MASKNTRPDWIVSPVEYGQKLRGFGINLLVSDMAASLDFAKAVLLANVVYWNEDFAVLRSGGAEFMFHADHTYSDHPLSGFVGGQEGRGQGAEFHLYELDPDVAEGRARQAGYTILAGSLNKPHGLRECYILDPDGYCWVASRPLAEAEIAGSA